VRPSDENQASLKQPGRPNLISPSRRNSHEDSILARLDGAPGARSHTGARLAWYGTAALIAVGLTATLAWLAAGTGEPALEMAQAREARTQDGQSAPPADLVRPAIAPLPQPQFAPEQPAAVIVDAPAAPAGPATAPPSTASPPMRLLDPAAGQAAPAPMPVPMPVPAPAPAPALAADLPAASVKTAPPRAVPGARPRAQPPRPTARVPARASRAGAGDGADDSDVALILAVIYHANGHAGGDEAATAACQDDACHTRANRP